MGRTTSQEAISAIRAKSQGLGEWRQRGREEVEARETSPNGDDRTDTCMEEEKREQSKLVDPLCLGDQEEVSGPNREGELKEKLDGK